MDLFNRWLFSFFNTPRTTVTLQLNLECEFIFLTFTNLHFYFFSGGGEWHTDWSNKNMNKLNKNKIIYFYFQYAKPSKCRCSKRKKKSVENSFSIFSYFKILSSFTWGSWTPKISDNDGNYFIFISKNQEAIHSFITHPSFLLWVLAKLSFSFSLVCLHKITMSGYSVRISLTNDNVWPERLDVIINSNTLKKIIRYLSARPRHIRHVVGVFKCGLLAKKRSRKP